MGISGSSGEAGGRDIVEPPAAEVATMRGRTNNQASMLAFIDPETLIPADHPLRIIKHFADAALAELSPVFDQLYAADGQGRASIPPERLLKASLLIALYSVRSERALCEELDYHLLFRWFLDMGLLEPSFDLTPEGAHLLLQTRTRALNGDLVNTFRRWYPAFSAENQSSGDTL